MTDIPTTEASGNTPSLETLHSHPTLTIKRVCRKANPFFIIDMKSSYLCSETSVSRRMLSKKNNVKPRALLVGTSFWCFTVWFKYVLMKGSLESRMLTVERVTPEMWDRIYRTEISHLMERNYFSGAILFLWLVYLSWKWVRVFRPASV